jgi:hypothetical protein
VISLAGGGKTASISQPTVKVFYFYFSSCLRAMKFWVLGFVGPCIFTHSNESTSLMQQLITGLLFVV